jgi:hypothetical protein
MEPLGNYVVDLNPKASGGLFKPDPHPKKNTDPDTVKNYN